MEQLAFYVVSDIHGYIFPTNFSKRDQYLPMGLLLANHLIEKDQQHYAHHIKIDNGDFLQGSPFCNYLVSHIKNSQPLVNFYNRMSFHFGTLGNHEFNYGLPYLKDTLNRLNYPVLCANIFENGELLTHQGIHYFDVNGKTIGVIGLTTQYIPHWEQPEHIQSLTFESAVTTLQRWLPEVRRQSDFVVVSYHGGFENDLETGDPTEAQTGENEGYAILEHFCDDIDIFITGHQHRDIATLFNQTAVIQPGTRGRSIGKVVLNFNDDTHERIASCSLLPVSDDDDFVINEDDRYLRSQLEDWLDTQIAELPNEMIVDDAFDARVAPHPFINFLNYVLLAKSGADMACTALFDSATGFTKHVTMRDVINNYPFPNTFKVLRVSGADIKAAIERSAEYFDVIHEEITISKDFMEPKPQHFNYDIFAGVSYTINAGQPRGQRVAHIQFNGEPLDFDKTYTICVNNYRSVGGGQYDMYTNAPVVKDIQIDGAQLIIDYLKEHSNSHIPEVVNFKVET